MASSNLQPLGTALGNLCDSIRALLFPLGALHALVFLVFAAAAYFAYRKYGQNRSMAWLAAAAVSALISLVNLIAALFVFLAPSFVSVLYGTPSGC
ncbi:Uncharacterised protein [uncultured archaeon]|nr:Uncharacterised protein [uncultured archaeon]